jgi:non-canonical purine NTP pyrophosphatase (RdgB/HAM1 family)
MARPYRSSPHLEPTQRHRRARPVGWVLVTGNESKWLEAQNMLGRPLERASVDLPAIHAGTTAEVALAKARDAFERVGRPVVVEEVGVEFAAFGGFPGPFIKYWQALGGLDAICRSLDSASSRAAAAVCVLAACDASGARAVEGRVAGAIVSGPRGTNGFGWDAIFAPEGRGGRTFAELSAYEKDEVSHRRLAWLEFSDRLAPP